MAENRKRKNSVNKTAKYIGGTISAVVVGVIGSFAYDAIKTNSFLKDNHSSQLSSNDDSSSVVKDLLVESGNAQPHVAPENLDTILCKTTGNYLWDKGMQQEAIAYYKNAFDRGVKTEIWMSWRLARYHYDQKNFEKAQQYWRNVNEIAWAEEPFWHKPKNPSVPGVPADQKIIRTYEEIQALAACYMAECLARTGNISEAEQYVGRVNGLVIDPGYGSSEMRGIYKCIIDLLDSLNKKK